VGEHGSLSYSTSRRAQLQRALGDLGEVLDRVNRGGGEFPAAGWYCRIGDGVLYLGDHTGVAFVTIAKLQEPEDE
jgi:hypothetical protein